MSSVRIEVEQRVYQSEPTVVSTLPPKEVYVRLYNEDYFFNSKQEVRKSNIPPVGSKFKPPHSDLRGDSPFGIQYSNI